MSYNNNYRRQRMNTVILFALVGIFFVSLMYEVTSDGVTAFFDWLPPIKWANFTADTIMNGLQLIIFSILAAALGTQYHQSGRNNVGTYRKNYSDQSNGGNRQIPQKPKYGNYGRKF